MSKIIVCKNFIATTIASVCCLYSYSQLNKTTYSTQFWYQYFNQIQLNEKWNITSDVGIRFKNNHTVINQTLIRVGLQYNINKIFSLSLGAANFNGYEQNKISIPEMRIWQEVSAKHAFFRLQIHHRLRIEERFLTNLLTKNKQNTLRLRYRLYFTYPLNHKTIEDKTVYLIAGDEFFVSYFRTAQSIRNTFQNRILAGIGYKLNDKLTITSTYANQLTQKNNLSEFDEATIIWVGIIHTLYIKPKKIQQ